MERYKFIESKEPYHWVCTDTELGIVLKWNEIDFDNTQEATLLEDAESVSPSVYAKAMREMTDWIVANHPESVMPDIKRILGQRLRYRREELGYSLRALSSVSDLSVNNIVRIEQGKYNYTIDILSRLCGYLDLGIDLFDGEEEDEE